MKKIQETDPLIARKLLAAVSNLFRFRSDQSVVTAIGILSVVGIALLRPEAPFVYVLPVYALCEPYPRWIDQKPRLAALPVTALLRA